MIRKNGLKIILLIIGILLSASVLIYALKNKVIHSEKDIVCTVYPLKLSLRDTLYYKDFTPFAVTRRWYFGDGNLSLSDSGCYQFSSPGHYTMKLFINNEFSKVIEIEVADTAIGHHTIDSLTTIDCPSQAMQFENVFFKANGVGGMQYRWSMGETGNIDSKEDVVVYAYRSPGIYVVKLFTDITQYPVTKRITILPSYKIVNDSTSLDDTYQKIDVDFKTHLQEIANGNSFNQHYNYLLKKFLCGNERVVVRVNNVKINDYNTYCLGLQFDRKVTIQSVKVGLDDAQKCVTKVDVQQTK